MLTDKERCEIAARLRDYDNLRESLRESPICAFLDALGVEGYMNWKGVCNLLANLIEPEPEKTCRNNGGFCAACGQELVRYPEKISVKDQEQKFTITFTVQPYCCRCGAKVQS